MRRLHSRPTRLLALVAAWLPSWIVWFFFFHTYYSRMPTAVAARAGAAMVGITIVLTLPSWWIATRMPWPLRMTWRFIAVHVMSALGYAVTFVYAVFLLWPARYGSVAEAMARSTQVPLVVFTSVLLYALTVGLCYAVQTRRHLSARDLQARRAEELAAEARRDAMQARTELEAVAELMSSDDEVQRVFIKIGNRVMPVLAQQIERLQACDDYVAIHTNGKRHLVHGRLKDFAKRLDATRFVQVHRSHVINLDYVGAFEEYDRSRLQVVLTGGDRIVASRPGTRLLRSMFGSSMSRP